MEDADRGCMSTFEKGGSLHQLTIHISEQFSVRENVILLNGRPVKSEVLSV